MEYSTWQFTLLCRIDANTNLGSSPTFSILLVRFRHNVNKTVNTMNPFLSFVLKENLVSALNWISIINY